MEVIDFVKQYEKLCFAFDKEYKEGQMLVYFEYLVNWKYESLAYAVNKAILHNQFFPKISELIELMKEYRETIPPERQLSENPEPPVAMPKEFRELMKSIRAKSRGGKR